MLRILIAPIATLALLASGGFAVSLDRESLPPPEEPLFSFEGPDALKGLVSNHARLELVDSPAGYSPEGGGKALRVHFESADWPNVFFPAGKKPWDWSGRQGLAVNVTNPNSFAVDVAMRIDNEGADGTSHCNTAARAVPAGRTITLSCTFNVGLDLGLWGMRGYPPLSKQEGPVLDPARIVAFQVFLPRPPEPRALILDSVRLFGKGKPRERPASKAFVDRFGQYAWADWPGKIKSEADFAAALAAEKKDLAEHPCLPDRDEFGGWLKGPKLEATGWFRSDKVGGKWWLVTPAGHLFFSLGIDCVGFDHHTIVEKRSEWFEWLPERGGEFAQHYGAIHHVHTGPVKQGATFSFLTANLQRQFGSGWREEWRRLTLARLPSWGFNTIANWSAPEIYLSGELPYTATVHIGGEHARVSSGADYWGKMHDVFDPEFERNARRAIEAAAHLWKGNPRCIGIFVDNELSWGHPGNFGLAAGALNAPAAQAAKTAFLADLRAKYGSIDRLNEAWKTGWRSWEEMAEKPAAPQGDLTADCKYDLDAFIYRFSLKYFQTVRDLLKAASPQHLYLGCRFAWGNRTSYRAAAEVCDVVSFNIYRETADPKDWGFTSDLGKPCIIGEFHFGALDRGMFHTGLVKSESQAERARKYADYVRSAADLPAFVGCHWFQYADQPLTGRAYDGENYNIGFIDAADQPYPEMTAAARRVHEEIYARRYDGGGLKK